MDLFNIIKHNMCLCTHSRTAVKITGKGGDFHRLPAFK